jgi:hypothetical protein
MTEKDEYRNKRADYEADEEYFEQIKQRKKEKGEAMSKEPMKEKGELR